MRVVIWEDETGFKRRALLPDNVPDAKAPLGIPQNPPDVMRLDMGSILREVNNQLVAGGLLTWQDVNLKQGAFRQACDVFRRHLIALFREKEEEANDD